MAAAADDPLPLTFTRRSRRCPAAGAGGTGGGSSEWRVRAFLGLFGAVSMLSLVYMRGCGRGITACTRGSAADAARTVTRQGRRRRRKSAACPAPPPPSCLLRRPPMPAAHPYRAQQGPRDYMHGSGASRGRGEGRCHAEDDRRPWLLGRPKKYCITPIMRLPRTWILVGAGRGPACWATPRDCSSRPPAHESSEFVKVSRRLNAAAQAWLDGRSSGDPCGRRGSAFKICGGLRPAHGSLRGPSPSGPANSVQLVMVPALFLHLQPPLLKGGGR